MASSEGNYNSRSKKAESGSETSEDDNGYENDWNDGGEMTSAEPEWGSGSFNNKDQSNTSLVVRKIVQEGPDYFLLQSRSPLYYAFLLHRL